jgi:hypothetical protein
MKHSLLNLKLEYAFLCVKICFVTRLAHSISLASWEDLLTLMDEIVALKAVDAYHVFQAMRRKDYFLYSALQQNIEYLPADALDAEGYEQ